MASAKPVPIQQNISFDHQSEPPADELQKNGWVAPPSDGGSPPSLCSLEQPAEPSDLHSSYNRARERKESENSDR